MTTESTQAPRGAAAPGSVTVLLGAAVAALVAGLVLALVGGTTAGTAAAFGAVAGTLLVVVVLAAGALTVGLVAGALPTASLLVALLTYTLQVLLLGLAFLALRDSGLLEGTLDARWVAGGVVAGTLVWLVAQVVLTVRVRIPVYDLLAPTAAQPGAGASGARPDEPEAGAR